MCATKKRPDGPPSILSGTDSDEKDKMKAFLAETLAKQLVQRKMTEITDFELHKLVYAIAQKTFLDDGTLAVPPKFPPLPSPPPRRDDYGFGYTSNNSNIGQPSSSMYVSYFEICQTFFILIVVFFSDFPL